MRKTTSKFQIRNSCWHITKQKIGKSLITLSKRKSTSSSEPSIPNVSIPKQLSEIQETLNNSFAATKENLEIIHDLTEDKVTEILTWLELVFRMRQVQELVNFHQLERTFFHAKDSSN